VSRDSGRQSRSRIVIQTPPARYQRSRQSQRPGSSPASREALIALSIVVAAALATFLALFVTSRPFDPMNSTVAPQQAVPVGPTATQPSPRHSPTPAPSTQNQAASDEQSPPPARETSRSAIPDDAAIQADIEKALAADATLAKLDVSTIVEAGRVTMVGSVRTPELKQRVEKVVRLVKGVSGVDNQLVVMESTP
jgi:hypothetical protein